MGRLLRLRFFMKPGWCVCVWPPAHAATHRSATVQKASKGKGPWTINALYLSYLDLCC